MTSSMPTEKDYNPAVVIGAKRMQRAYYRRKNGPWQGVVTPWSMLTDLQRYEFLRVAAIFNAAHDVHDGDPALVADTAATELAHLSPASSHETMAAYMAKLYADYFNPQYDGGH